MVPIKEMRCIVICIERKEMRCIVVCVERKEMIYEEIVTAKGSTVIIIDIPKKRDLNSWIFHIFERNIA